MDKDKKILLWIIGSLILFALILGGLAYFSPQERSFLLNDAQKFKQEYEALNHQINESNKMNYPLVAIKEENPIVYKTDDEVAEFLEDGTGILYFGFSSCPWCRTMVPYLLQAADNTNLGEIIYVDIKNIRTEFTLDENDTVIVTKEGTNGYHGILKKLDSVLEPYYLTNKKNKKIDTFEKRLFAPTVIALKKGKVVDIHVDTVDTQKSGYTELTKEESEKLVQIYQKMMLKLIDSTCDESC
ncbi:MAG: hypothetical protein HFH86_02205 [Bacilli bacterium]|jgi:thiol-disulfide isomerase/thioredoxin|nr:hypothetical protein [Bacilli bacterium]